MSMTTYPIPDTLPELTITATDFIEGLSTYADEAGLGKNSAATIQSDLNRATVLDAEYEAVRGSKSAALYPALRKADKEGRGFITQAKKPLAFHLGEDWSEKWIMAGLKNGTTQVPKTLEGRETLLADLAAYFAKHPGHEVVGFGVTAARARQLYLALAGARAAVEAQKDGQKAARSARDKAITTLRKRIRATISELDLQLEADSPVWASLGLTPPAQKVKASRKSKTKAVEAKITTATASTRITADATEVALAK